MSLTKTRETTIDGIPVQVDPGLAQEPHNPKRAVPKELYALPGQSRPPVLKSASPAETGRRGLVRWFPEPFTSSWPARIFVLLAIRAKPGDIRNEPFIRDWQIIYVHNCLKNWLT